MGTVLGAQRALSSRQCRLAADMGCMMKTKWVLSFVLLMSWQMHAGVVAEQDQAASDSFTPEQEAIVKRLIDAAVAKAMADAKEPSSLQSRESAGSSARASSQPAPPRNRCVLGFAPSGCVEESEAVLSGETSIMALSPLILGSSDDEAEQEIDAGSMNLAPMGYGVVEYDSALMFAPAGRSFAGLPKSSKKPSVQGDITFSEDGSIASLRYAWEYAKLSSRPDALIASVDGWSVQISSPVDDKARKRANLATLNGFSSGLGMSLEYTRQRSDLRAKNPEDLRRDLGLLCIAVGLQVNCNYDDARTQAKSPTGNKDIDDARAGALAKFQRKQFRWLRDYALRVDIGRERFDYLTDQLDPRSEYHIGHGVGATAAFVSPTRRWMYLLGADYQKGRENAEAAILCPPSGGGVVTCVEGAIGGPSAITKKLLSAEMRGNFGAVGYSLRVAHDLESDTTGIDLPIYLLRNAEGALTGGLRLGWSSESDVAVGIFLSSPFKW